MIHNISRFIAALAIILLTAQTAGATETSTITVGSTDYTLFTGFTATGGNGTNYAKLVDGNTSTDWHATKNYDDPNAPANDFAGGTDDPAFVEFHADEPIVPKGYVLTCDHENAGFWKPVEWALKAKLNEGDAWTTIHSSNTTLGVGKTFEIACDNDGDNQYQYFRFEVYEVGATMNVDLDELQFYGLLPAYTHLTVKAATCMATGIKVDCYRRNSDGKYFTDNTGETEIPESDVIAPMIPHTGEHHEATDVNIEYWQCSMCGKYFSDSGYTTEITEEQTKIYRTITIDGSISGLVEVAFGRTQALAGANVLLRVMDDRIDISTLKVNDGAVEVIPDGGDWYKFTMPAADVTVTAEVAQSNVDGDILTGSIKHRVTITDGASITLNNAIISGSIVCEGSATITLVGTNSVSGATNKAGIQIGGSGTTLTIRGDGLLTVTGGDWGAGIGLSAVFNYDSNVSSGDIVIEGGTITTTGGKWGAGIGTGVVKNTNNNNSTSVQFGNITIKGGSVTAIGGDSGDGIGKGYAYSGPTITIGTVTICDGIDKVDASSIKNFGSVVYMHGETNVTASKTDYFAIGEDGNRKLIVQKPVIAEIADQTYTGSEITPEPTVTIGSLTLTKSTDYEYSYTNNTNVGTATVRATFQGDYASLGYVERTFTIGKGTPTVTAPTAIDDLIYNGSAQALVTTGSTDFGTLLYSLDGNTYAADIPTATDAANYTVYYKVEATDNWNAVDAATVAVSIAAKAVTVTADDQTKEYGQSDPTLTATVEGLIGEDAITYTLSRIEGEAVGTYDIIPAGDAAQGNYAVTFVAGTMTITSNPTLALTANLAPDENYWTTFYCGDAGYTIDDGENACAYTATYADGKLTLHNQGKEIPQGTAVIIVADNNEVSMTETDLSTFSGDNDLRGVDVETSTADIQTRLGSGTFYVLGMTEVSGEQHFGFHKYEGTEMAARKAFVLVNGDGAALTRSLTMVFDDATGITTTNYTNFTNSDDAWYSLDGQRLMGKPAKSGIYINNGKKVVIK